MVLLTLSLKKFLISLYEATNDQEQADLVTRENCYLLKQGSLAREIFFKCSEIMGLILITSDLCWWIKDCAQGQLCEPDSAVLSLAAVAMVLGRVFPVRDAH